MYEEKTKERERKEREEKCNHMAISYHTQEIMKIVKNKIIAVWLIYDVVINVHLIKCEKILGYFSESEVYLYKEWQI